MSSQSKLANIKIYIYQGFLLVISLFAFQVSAAAIPHYCPISSEQASQYDWQIVNPPDYTTFSRASWNSANSQLICLYQKSTVNSIPGSCYTTGIGKPTAPAWHPDPKNKLYLTCNGTSVDCKF